MSVFLQPIKSILKQHAMHLIFINHIHFICAPFNRVICIANRYHVHDTWAPMLVFSVFHLLLIRCRYSFYDSDCIAIKNASNENRDNVYIFAIDIRLNTINLHIFIKKHLLDSPNSISLSLHAHEHLIFFRLECYTFSFDLHA